VGRTLAEKEQDRGFAEALDPGGDVVLAGTDPASDSR
jgi:hypothetical protein